MWVLSSNAIIGCGDNGFLPFEDCARAGDEDGNGEADCGDPACVDAPSCGCGSGTREDGEACDDGNLTSGDGCDSNCTLTACGNGIVTTGEACDDANLLSDDGCDSNCTPTACGNGIRTTGEACDDANLTNGDGCDGNCTLTACGNGIVTTGEACDDGNLTSGDGCDGNCTPTACGNGIATGGEGCDDGNTLDGDGCDNNCTPTACGNGIPTAGEACDDGNGVDTDDCRDSCALPFCGDGVASTGATGSRHEDCDGAPSGGMVPVETATCNLDCTAQVCGDSKLNQTAGEECDDGNASNTDACINVCLAAVCGDGFLQDMVEQCDDGNAVTEVCAYGVPSCTVCAATCALTPGQTSACGDGIAQTPFEACDDGNAVDGDWCDQSCTLPTLAPPIYVKASNTGAADLFGVVAMSSDGSTLAVSARVEDSAATGVGGDQTDNSAPSAGAVYIFIRSGTTWVQQAYLKASNTGAMDAFGAALALSADGSTLAVGAPFEASAATGVGGNQTNNSAADAGAVYVFTRSGTTWSQQAYVKASNTGTADLFGASVALSGDGSTLAVGAVLEDSAATGVGGDQADNTADNAGAVYVFTRSGAMWSQQAYVKASGIFLNADFGTSVALSGDGSILGVGSPQAGSPGAVYVFTRAGTAWSPQARVVASNRDSGDAFGQSVALSSDGSTLVVGAPFEDSAATGVGGDQADNSVDAAGAVYVFTRSGATWNQHAYVKASSTGVDDYFGYRLALSGDGSTLAVGAVSEDSAATGIGGDQADNSAVDSGAVYVFTRSGTTWSQQAYVKASNTGANDSFGEVALSADGLSLAVGAVREDSAATGIGGDQSDNSAAQAGAVYVFR